MIRKYVELFTNSELVEFVKILKKNKNILNTDFKLPKNLIHLLNLVRDETEISFPDFIVNLEYEIKEELLDRIAGNKIIIY